jgi:RNA polymerase sigma factor (sigma-70 family)
MSNGKFRFHIIKTADVLGCSPEDLFTDTQMSMAIKNNKYCLKVNEAEVKCMIDQNNQPLLLEDHVFEDQKNKLLKKALETLPIREKKILSLRFGLDDGKEHTYQDISDEFGCSRENIRRIESQALRRLRHPSRSDQLQDLI